jgi:hypothetical protein
MVEVLLGAAAAGSTAAAVATPAAAAWVGGATATASAATTLGTLGSTALTILSGVATVASIAGNLQAAEASAQQSLANAMQADLEGGQQRLASTQRQTAMKRELARVLGENDVAIAAAGIDLSGGIAESSRASAMKAATRELSIERSDDDARRALIKARANGYRRQAASYRTGGMLAAFGDAADYGIGVMQRG